MCEENVIVRGSGPHERIDSAWALPGSEDVPPVFAVLTFVVVAQLFGIGTSLSLGSSPDSPSPSGQVNRVVERVTVHPYGGR
jgi:tagatose-6-phosphate ketose/aldose isomerase